MELKIELSDFIVKTLASLDHPHLPELVSVKLARQMYPWVDELFETLKKECKKHVVKQTTDELFWEAILGVEKSENV